jgi:hypothetical protein
MMKKLALAFLALALPALGQQVDSTQMKLKTNGGLGGDAASALGIAVYRNTSAPSSPITGGLWCDTSFSPCILKIYNGSTWESLATASIPTQTDAGTFPGSPTDGQLFFSKNPYAIYVYDGTAAVWSTLTAPLQVSGAAIRDLYTSTTHAAPGAATATASATAGSLSAGTYSYQVTCRNANGGETTGGTTSNTITSLVSKSVDLSSIPLCGGTAVARGIYRTKVNQAATGPWWWVTTITDDSTTTANDGVADSALVLTAPDINFSGDVPTGWSVTNSSGTASGGCGVTARHTLGCLTGNTLSNELWCNSGGISNDTWVRADLDISSYASGNYTIQYRVTQISGNGDTYPAVTSAGGFGGLRNGSADNAIRWTLAFGGAANTNCNFAIFTFPASSSNHPFLGYVERTTVGGATGNASQPQNPYPAIDALPFWVRIVKSGNSIVYFLSSDGRQWNRGVACSGSPTSTAACSLNAVFGSSSTYFEIAPVHAGYAYVSQMTWIEIDSLTLTVN